MGSPCLFTRQQALKMGYFYLLHVKSLKHQNGFRTTLERLSCHSNFKLTQAQTKVRVSFFYVNPLLQVEFRAIFEPFSYILLNGLKRNAMLSRM